MRVLLHSFFITVFGIQSGSIALERFIFFNNLDTPSEVLSNFEILEVVLFVSGGICEFGSAFVNTGLN